jgi:hypothetical protein
MLIKNRAWCLPWVLGCLKGLTYPKAGTHLLFIEDASSDNSPALLKRYRRLYGRQYASCDVIAKTEDLDGATSARDTSDRLAGYPHLSELRNEAMEWVVASGAEHWLSLDSDILIAPDIIEGLQGHNLPYVGSIIFNDIGALCSHIAIGVPISGRYPNFGIQSDAHSWKAMTGYEFGRLYPVHYTGAVALANRQVIDSGVRYGVNPIGDQPCEDYAFCKGLTDLGIPLYADTTRRAVHIMRPANLQEALGVFYAWFGLLPERVG